jgi:hypothetical protein
MPMIDARHLVIAILMTLCASACGLDGAAQLEPTSVYPTPSEAQIVRTPTSFVLSFELSGGFVGITQKWEVFENGIILRDGNAEFNVSSVEVGQLVRRIQDLGFFELLLHRPDLSSCADCFMYILTVREDGRSKTISWMDGQQDYPEAFANILQEVNSFFAPFPRN